MKKIIAAFVFLATLTTVITLSNKSAFNQSNSDSDSITAQRKIYVDMVNETIKGKEEMASDSVFKDIELMKSVPAGRLVMIMDKGFSNALGVSCDHCHNTENYASNEKNKKQIAREMMKMSGDIREMISNIKEIESKEATINCTTCHRGEIIPATKLK